MPSFLEELRQIHAAAVEIQGNPIRAAERFWADLQVQARHAAAQSSTAHQAESYFWHFDGNGEQRCLDRLVELVEAAGFVQAIYGAPDLPGTYKLSSYNRQIHLGVYW